MVHKYLGNYYRRAEGRYFVYVVCIDQSNRLFRANVYDANGDKAGAPELSQLTEADLDPENCKRWIEECIRDKLGVR